MERRPVAAGDANAGDLFSDDQIDALIALTMEEVTRYAMSPHPVDFASYDIALI